MKSSQPYVPDSGASTQVPGTAAAGPREMLPYVAPMLTFLVLTNLEGYLPGQGWYPPAYAAKVLVVALVAWCFRSTWSDLRPIPPATTLLLATMVGLVVFVLWVRLEGWYPASASWESELVSTPPPWMRTGSGRSSRFG